MLAVKMKFMSQEPETPRSLREQVWGAADPEGETRALINAAIHGTESLQWLADLGVGIGEQWERMRLAGLGYRTHMEGIEAALERLVPRGWAVMLMRTEAIDEAIRLVSAGEGKEADEWLSNQWDGEGAWRTKRVCDRVQVMGTGEPDYHALFRHRARLLRKAKEHHEAGRYDASIPLLQAQMEGIVMDVTQGRKFFTKGTQKADLVDRTQLVSIEAGLAALQATYGQDVKITQAAGSLSRHGVMHGRELAYDTRVNSAKTWSVLDALVEWALPKAREVVVERRVERQAANEGSQEVTEDGRRVDDREFSETRGMLRILSTSAMGWHRQRDRFRGDLVAGVYGANDFINRGLPAEPGIHTRVRDDGHEVMYWRETASGWVLGIAVTQQHGGFGEHLYAGPHPPAGLPSERPTGWGGLSETPADWG